MQKPGPKLSNEDFGTQMGTCTASGPLNPFLEQILKELPSANISSEVGNSTAFTGVTFTDGFDSQKSTGKSGNAITKKIRSNIEKQTVQISKKQMQNSLLNTFNLTTTAAALLAASNKNAADTKTQTNSNINVAVQS